ncbi:MAG: pitrilysin family protein [Sedimentisphaerales bacterium]|nr:pitrilysin family protein [Sedimentisphaerales bacterium]
MRPVLKRIVSASYLAILCIGGLKANAQELEDFQRRLTQFRLDNGLQVLVYTRPRAPVAAFLTFADVGAVDEERGKTGLAHLFEHMAFKGTRTIGTRSYAAEARALERIDRIFDQIRSEKAQPQPDPNRLALLEKQFQQAQQAAQAYMVHDEFEQILQRAGSRGLNAGTGSDYTVYFVNLPANKMELWMSLESERFLCPVLREFYKERAVVMEERRLRVESDPMGRLFEEFLAVAFKAHPYGTAVIGHMSDLEAVSRRDAEEFFRRHYVPEHLTVVIVGDVDPDKVKALARRYFGRLKGSGPRTRHITQEPPQPGPRKVILEDQAQPVLLLGFRRPGINHADSAVYQAIADIMGEGRTARVYTALVKEKRIAMDAGVLDGLPGERYPCLFGFYALPARGHTNEECEQAIWEQIERLKREPVTDEELQKAKTRARAALIRQLGSNMGLARNLAYYQVITGDWRNLFRQLDRIRKVSADDIQRVAEQTFVERNCTTAYLKTTVKEGQS